MFHTEGVKFFFVRDILKFLGKIFAERVGSWREFTSQQGHVLCHILIERKWLGAFSWPCKCRAVLPGYVGCHPLFLVHKNTLWHDLESHFLPVSCFHDLRGYHAGLLCLLCSPKRPVGLLPHLLCIWGGPRPIWDEHIGMAVKYDDYETKVYVYVVLCSLVERNWSF